MNPAIQSIRKLVNHLGFDVIRYQGVNSKQRKNRGSRLGTPKRLNIGGGTFFHPDWHNVDFPTGGYEGIYRDHAEGIDVPHDLSKFEKIKLPDNSIEAVYTSHIIEHLKEDHVAFLFQDVFRLLKKDGYFRVVCPNADLYVNAFLNKDLSFFHYRDCDFYKAQGISDSLVGLFIDCFAGKLAKQYSYEEIEKHLKTDGTEKTLNWLCNQTPYEPKDSNLHVSWYNQKKLTEILRKAGFSNVYVSGFGQSCHSQMREVKFFDNSGPFISLYVEARK